VATLFFLISALSLISLITHNKNDPGFGKFENTDQINNYLGIYGANVSSFLYEFTGLGAYLIPVFLFFQSVKIIKTKDIWFVILVLRIFIFFTSFVILSTFVNYVGANSGLLGSISYDLLINQKFLVENSFSFIILLIICFVIGMLLLFLSFALPARYLKYLKIISEKVLYGSPSTINRGLYFTYIYIFFYFIKVNYRKII